MPGYGFQSDQLQKAIELIRDKKKVDKIVLAFTGNLISSGLRNHICHLAKEKLVDAFVTNGAGVEEDIIQTFGTYCKVEFECKASTLISKKLYRIGNLAVEHGLYDKFFEFLEEQYSGVISDPKCDQTPGEISKQLADLTNDTDSFLYWANRNNIDVYCPTFHDGAFGDFFVDYRTCFTNYRIDFLLENVKLTNLLNSFDRVGAVILGGGASKHFTLNNSILRGGYDWVVIVTTAIPFDGSDSGGNAEEAKTWGKLKPNGKAIQVFSDATLVFPEIVRECFNQN